MSRPSKTLEEVDRLLEPHVRFLDEAYAQGIFLASGRRVPRTGGVILDSAESRAILEAVLTNDPFCQEGVATYDIIEFVPSKMAPALEGILS
jgi:uncharacterized protein YciI